MYRIWPDAWREPYEFTTITGVSHVPFSMETLHLMVKRRSACADTFEKGQVHKDRETRISKAEALVIRQFKECWDSGMDCLRSVELRGLEPSARFTSPFEEQNSANWVLERLQQGYGSNLLRP